MKSLLFLLNNSVKSWINIFINKILLFTFLHTAFTVLAHKILSSSIWQILKTGLQN